MARYINVLLTLLLIAVLMVQAHDTQAETLDERDAKANSSGYYPADSLNQVTLGLLNGKKYVFVDQNCSWFEASYFCNAYGMDLVTIETQNENDLLMEQITALGKQSIYFWTAGHKLGRSTWLWLNGENMIFSDWAPGNPNTPTRDHCLIISSNDWFDTPCNYNEPRGYICEERLAIK